MTQTIIDQLCAWLYDNKWCHHDFENYDVKYTADNEPFFWLAYNGGTAMSKCSTDYICSILTEERNRIALFRDPEAPIASIAYYSNHEYRAFYFDGRDLHPVTISQIRKIWHNFTDAAFRLSKEAHPNEAAHCNDLLQLRFSSTETEASFKADLAWGAELGDSSLQDAVSRLRHWNRQAVDHCIYISPDFVRHSYAFVELINGNPGVNGCIVYQSYDERRWTLHT